MRERGSTERDFCTIDLHLIDKLENASRQSEKRVLGSIPGRATYFRFSFRFFKRDSCQLLAKVCAQSTG